MNGRQRIFICVIYPRYGKAFCITLNVKWINRDIDSPHGLYKHNAVLSVSHCTGRPVFINGCLNFGFGS